MAENIENTYVEVINRHDGTVGYTIPDAGITRTFTRGENKKIALSELEQLSWVAGGEYILKNYLMIKDKSALSYLNMENVEPEYFYSEEDVKKLLTEGTLDQLDDCLTFGNEGVIDLVKDLAVKMELPDTRKRKLILEKTGFNIDTAININDMMKEDVKAEEPVTTGRKAAPISTDAEPAKPVRKASTGFKSMTS